MPPTNAPSGIANRVSTRENPKTLPCIFDGTVSWRTVATIVFHAILQVIAIPKAIPGASQYVLQSAKVKPIAPTNRSNGIRRPRCNLFLKELQSSFLRARLFQLVNN